MGTGTQGIMMEITNFLDYLSTNDFAAWTLFLTLAIGVLLFVWTIREFSNWFFRTRKILDEQLRFQNQLSKMSTQLRRLESSISEVNEKLSSEANTTEPVETANPFPTDSKKQTTFDVSH